MTTIAIMQPYFFPYGGYYRLFAAADIFVILDCVQFPRRSRVYRSELKGEGRWLTLPLSKSPRNSLIRDIVFAPDARERLQQQLESIGTAVSGDTALRQGVVELLNHPEGHLVPFLEASLRLVVSTLDLDCKIIRSSDLNVADRFRGQDRIIEIARQLKATCYVNSPGGVDLYDQVDFEAVGIELRFLSDYHGALSHFLPKLFEVPRSQLRNDILESYTFKIFSEPS